MTDNNRKFSSFDTIKFVAILLCTTIGHFFQFTPRSYEAVCETGWMTSLSNVIMKITLEHTHTIMEFLLLIGGFQLYLAYHDRIRDNMITFFEYFKKRFIRLYPPMILSTVVMSIGLLIYKHYTGEEWRGVFFTFRGFVMSILGIQAWASDIHVLNGPLWYLSVYILCVIVYYPLEKIAAKYKMGVIALFIPPVLALCHYFNPESFAFLHNDVCRGFYGFFVGTVFAAAYRFFDKKKLTIFSIVSIFIYLVLYVTAYEQTMLDGVDRALVTCIIFYGPVLLLLSSYEKADRVIGCKSLAFLGKTSFHLYCINFPFFVWMMILQVRLGLGINYDSFFTFVMFTVVQILISVLLYYLVDKKLCVWLGNILTEKTDK